MRRAENKNAAAEPTDRLDCRIILEGGPMKGEGGGLTGRLACDSSLGWENGTTLAR
jgi:hypothetical protein